MLLEFGHKWWWVSTYVGDKNPQKKHFSRFWIQSAAGRYSRCSGEPGKVALWSFILLVAAI